MSTGCVLCGDIGGASVAVVTTTNTGINGEGATNPVQHEEEEEVEESKLWREGGGDVIYLPCPQGVASSWGWETSYSIAYWSAVQPMTAMGTG